MPYLVIDPSVAQGAPAITYGAPDDITTHPRGKSLLGMRTRLILELGNRNDIPVAIWNEWINDSYTDFHASLELPESKRSFTFDAAEQQPFYLLPDSVDTIRDVSIVDTDDSSLGAKLEKTDASTYRKLPTRCGTPEIWFREQNMIILWPTPDDTYPIVVDPILKPAKLVNDGDYPIVEDKWHELIYKGAKWRAWEGVQNDTKAALVENATVRQLNRINDRDARDNENEYPAIRPVRTRADILSLRRRLTPEPGDS